MALDLKGNVYVSDWGNDRIQKFDPAGNFLDAFPKYVSGQPKSDWISHPAGLAVGPEGYIYVADWGNERVRVLSAEGEVLATLRGNSETPPWADDYFLANPEEGALWLEAYLEPVMQSPARKDREESANVEKLFWGPTSVKLDEKGNILIVDSCRHRIQVYRNDG